VNREPLREIAAMTRGMRKIGLGVMGFAECLILLGVSYASGEAVTWADRLMRFIRAEADEASRQLARERGVFPHWERSVHAAAGDRLRNATRLSIAPTGTIAIIAGTSGGIEPLFGLAYRRAHTLGGAPLVEVNPVFIRYLEKRGLDSAALVDAMLCGGRVHDVVDEAAGQLFVTATEIPSRQHLRIQQAFQRHVDNAVSKTINLPEDATVSDVREAYVEAWRLGLKGVTIYRYGSLKDQVLTLGAGDDMTSREFFAQCDPGACRL
jgi:ribonucleoside-diphosphate reductase alpha chain